MADHPTVPSPDEDQDEGPAAPLIPVDPYLDARLQGLCHDGAAEVARPVPPAAPPEPER